MVRTAGRSTGPAATAVRSPSSVPTTRANWSKRSDRSPGSPCCHCDRHGKEHGSWIRVEHLGDEFFAANRSLLYAGGGRAAWIDDERTATMGARGLSTAGLARLHE